jgi:hypothetical protein
MVKYTRKLPCNINGKWPSRRTWYIEFKILFTLMIYYKKLFEFVPNIF